MSIRLALLVSVLLLSGSGCIPLQRLESALAKLPWFEAPSSGAASAALAIPLQAGLAMTVRPSAFGVTGAVEEALGNEERALRVTVREAAPETFTALEWKSASATGTLALAFYEDAEAMLLPAFWPPGASEARHNGGIWMPRAAFEKVNRGEAVEWRLGLAEQALSSVSSALKKFNELTSLLTGSATSTIAASPFQLRKTGASETYPLLIDGKLTFVRVVRVTSWFADYFVLDNPQNPLILKAVVHPAAQPALKALEPTSVRWDEIGYEITALSRP